MGKLVDTLVRAGKATAPSIGFVGRSVAAGKPKAAAILVEGRGETADALIKAGADAIIVPPETDVAALKEANVAWGFATTAQTTAETLKGFHEKGADFALLPLATPTRVALTPIEHFERVLIVPPPENDPLLLAFRAYNVLEADIALLDVRLSARDLASLTLESYTKLRQLTEILRFPTIISLQDVPAKDDMITLARLGAQGVLLEKATPETVAALREGLESVPREREHTNTPTLGGGR